jgi:hypothetical protein
MPGVDAAHAPHRPRFGKSPLPYDRFEMKHSASTSSERSTASGDGRVGTMLGPHDMSDTALTSFGRSSSIKAYVC